ncbi:MAG TPA: acyltransferase family protein [Candidatus Binatia bacterium]|nr:acyltransferase family protein [Candidatus Binatia bacterium]
MTTAQRIASLDVAKGVAILFVIGIHAELLFPGILYTHVISRAVPMFLVFFGITSTMWWDAHSDSGRLGSWYRSRVARLLPPYWLAVLVWWSGQQALSDVPVGFDALAWSLVAYAPWIQTSWFVTAILQIVLMFPLLRSVPRAIGFAPSLAIAAATMATAQTYALSLNAWLHALLPHSDVALGFYAFWIFVPHYFWLVLCGMALVSLAAGVTPAQALVAIVLFVTPGLVEPLVTTPSAISRVSMSLADPGRAVLLLAAAAIVAPLARCSALLVWLGRNSWEIYVGQMAVHSLGYSAWCRMGGPTEHRYAYAALLTIGGVAFAVVYSELRRRLSASEARA